MNMEKKYIRSRKNGEMFCYNPNAEFNGNIRLYSENDYSIVVRVCMLNKWFIGAQDAPTLLNQLSTLAKASKVAGNR